MKRRSQKDIVFNLILVFLIIIICLFIAEIGSRIYLIVSGKGGYVLLPDNFLGRIHAPNSHFVFEEDFSKEFRVKRKTNSLGLIGEEVSIDKPQGTFRILVLGDSFTEALQVDEGKNFCEQLQYLLNSNLNLNYKHYEVLNAGISGSSPISEYLLFKRELIKLKPDLVILQLFANDVFEDNKIAAMSVIADDGLPIKINRFFKNGLFDSLKLDYNSKFLEHYYNFKKFILKKSKFLQVLSRIENKFSKRNRYHKYMTGLPMFNDSNQFFIIQDYNPLFQDREFRKNTWEKTQKYILAIEQLAKGNKAGFFVVLIPPEAQLKKEKSGVETDLFFTDPPNLYFNRSLVRFCKRQRIIFLDLLPYFKKNKNMKLYYYKDQHLRDEGHRLVADNLYNFLIKNKLIR